MRRRLLGALLAVLLLALAGCAKSEAKLQSTTLFAMDTVMDLSVYGDAALLQDAAQTIRTLEAQISVTDEASELAAINRTGYGTLTGDAAALMQQALELCALTDGALDISIYPVVQAWGFTLDTHRVPDEAQLASLLESVDYRKIRFQDGAVTLEGSMQIDLGSVAKGYASQRITDDFRAKGVTSALLNLGGNVQVLGTKPDGSLWRIAVQDPGGDGNLGVLELADRAVVTSGGYERYFEENGEVYWHILDPATGYPAKNGLISVTVVGTDGCVCDALSTALFVMGTERAIDFWRQNGGFEAVFVTENGELLITEGLQDCFTPMGEYAGKAVAVISHD